MNIAIIRTDRLGDMVLTLPMFPALRTRFPDARLTLFTRSYVHELVDGLSCIDEVVYTDVEDFVLSKALAHRHIDTVFFPRAAFREIWSALRAGVRTRIGTANRWYSLLYNKRIREHRSRAEHHEAEYNVRMISHTFGLPQPDVHLVRPLAKPAPSPSIIIHPGSGMSSPQWPAEFFGAAAQQLRISTGLNVIITGIPSENALCAVVAQMCPDATNACGAYTLGEMIAVVGGARLVLANATGILHLAAALGTPVVGFYPDAAPVSARRWRPYTSHARVLTSTANNDMTTISVEDAVRASLELIGIRSLQ